MAKSFLRSGSLEDILALGENGQPVYASALQLRETLRLRKQQQLVDCLAIPQPNEDGTRLDWYAPIAGKVTSWIAASQTQRNAAIRQLETVQQTVAEISQRAQTSPKSAQQLFGVLLAKAIQFPDQNYVYLVGGKPVLTFWGFTKLDKKPHPDALACLRQVEEEAEPLPFIPAQKAITSTAAPVKITPPEPAPSEAIAPKIIEPQPAAPETTPVSTASKPTFWRLWWMAPAAVLVGILAIQTYGYFSTAPKTPQPTAKVAAPATPATTEPEKRLVAAKSQSTEQDLPLSGATVKPEIVTPSLIVATSGNRAPTVKVADHAENEANKPQATELTPPAVKTDEAPTEVKLAPPAKNALILPADEVKIGSTKFLNGKWRAVLDNKDPITGKQPILHYQFKNGAGTLRAVIGNGVICRASVKAGLMKSGSLALDRAGKGTCSNGSRFQVPDVLCVQAANGAAECKGRYDANTVIPMTMKYEGK
ncbi:SrfA family protein [Rouxiella sp. Mn2063]|uniref:SrfA family protein n=1 Tax=Rouxiella sp. Mn2063 TaxID=3395262 RepID=UPI003BC8AB7D